MIIEMKYTDSIKDNPIKNDWNDASIEELLKEESQKWTAV